ncbi:sensor domain-containing diguanylate cyclase [Tistrella mobilis]|uniref:diguanylate cyclase n=1 Tax=Tistrella mobilis (strain KA081020-065) TaxID=1110502 RepID=I3TTV9_TISMK|nr:sensor domain-containing diguanylate cyclase [Tistrella mobilis]AFK56197.1 diguanylate cyclase [Tistrella mobilis KA081020-065]
MPQIHPLPRRRSLARLLFRVDLQRMIVALAVAAAGVLLANGFYSSYLVQRQVLIDTTLKANHAYAAKLAEAAQNFIEEAQQQLAYSAGIVARDFDNENLLLDEAERLRLQTHSFNSVAIVDAGAIVRATSPEALQIKGRYLRSLAAREALDQRRPLVSQPYMAITGNMLVVISQPVFTADGRYLGYIGGTIYLRERNILNVLLGTHHYDDGSYLYVADQGRALLYHPDPARIGEVVSGNPVIEAAITGVSGSGEVVNSRGVAMLAGYAPVPATGWGVVAQRPLAVTLAPLEGLMWRVAANSAPAAVVTLVAIWWFARAISRPLGQLAEGARQMDAPGTADRIQRVRSWYVEARQIKRAMLIGIGLLQARIGRLDRDARTDPLTGLINRRGMDDVLELWRAEARPFAAIAVDIDHFKQVNDSWGHEVGDAVLRRVGLILRQTARDTDLVCRTGGEEFLLLLPGLSSAAAVAVAERLRKAVARERIDPAGHVTVSAGVAVLPEDATDIGAALRLADEMLYEAKRAGRNRVVAAGSPRLHG